MVGDDQRSNKAVLPRLDVLRKATIAGTPITQQKEALEAAGVYVSYNSLRKFIQKYLGPEYREFLANSRTTGSMPDELHEAPQTKEEQAEIDSFLNTGKPAPEEGTSTSQPVKPARTAAERRQLREPVKKLTRRKATSQQNGRNNCHKNSKINSRGQCNGQESNVCRSSSSRSVYWASRRMPSPGMHAESVRGAVSVEGSRRFRRTLRLKAARPSGPARRADCG